MLRAVRATTRHISTWLPYVAVTTVALFARLFPVLHGGGLKGVGGYDDGVYFAASEALVHGRVPYRDFMLLHPPGLIYLLTPFALLAHQVGDANAWAAARVFVMLLGVASAVLVTLILRPYGTTASLTGGLLYAVWFPALNAEFSTLLEGPSNAMLLGALLLLTRRGRAEAGGAAPGWRSELAAGAMLGLAASTKIWGVVPFLVVVAWQAVTRGRRAASWVLAGGVAMVAVVCGPVFAFAPARMLELVVGDQLQRSDTHTSLLLRAADFTPVSRLLPGAANGATIAALVVVGAVGLVCADRAWTVRSARVFVVLLLAQTAVLLASPSYFPHYGAYLAPAVALTAGTAVGVLAERFTGRSRLVRRALPAALLVGFAALAAPVVVVPRMAAFDATAVRAALTGRRCVEADTPSSLILSGALSPDLARGCPTRIDVTGPTYNVDRVVGTDGRTVPRVRNPLWQRDILAYLRSGNAAMVTRSEADGFSEGTRRALRHLTLLYRGRDVTVYATGG
ncbi:MAG: glycosyltransferase 87 family protein [Actinomycetales bacterium]